LWGVGCWPFFNLVTLCVMCPTELGLKALLHRYPEIVQNRLAHWATYVGAICRLKPLMCPSPIRMKPGGGTPSDWLVALSAYHHVVA